MCEVQYRGAAERQALDLGRPEEEQSVGEKNPEQQGDAPRGSEGPERSVGHWRDNPSISTAL